MNILNGRSKSNIWVGLPAMPKLMHATKKHNNASIKTKSKKKKNDNMFLIIDESDRTEDTTKLSSDEQHKHLPCRSVIDRRNSMEAFSRRSSAGSGASGNSSMTHPAVKCTTSSRQRMQHSRRSTLDSSSSEVRRRRSSSNSSTRHSSQAVGDGQDSRRSRSTSRSASLRRRRRSESRSQSRQPPPSSNRALVVATTTATSKSAPTPNATQEQVGCCPHHPYVQLQKYSKRTKAWKTLLDSCPVCDNASMKDNEEESGGESLEEMADRQPRTRVVQRNTSSKSRSGGRSSSSRSRSTSQTRTPTRRSTLQHVPSRRQRSTSSSRSHSTKNSHEYRESRRSSLQHVPTASSATSLEKVKRVSFAE